MLGCSERVKENNEEVIDKFVEMSISAIMNKNVESDKCQSSSSKNNKYKYPAIVLLLFLLFIK